MKAWLALERFRPGASFRPWLVQIAVNEARNRRRSAGRRAGLALRLNPPVAQPESAPSAEAEALAVQERAQLAAAVGQLREDDQLIIAARYFLGLSEAEAAIALSLQTWDGEIAAVACARTAAASTGGDAMSGELEQRLLALGTALDVPPAPDTVPAVLAGLPARRRRRRRPARRVLAVALAAMLLLVGAAMAVPPTRDAILRAIGLRGVSIERVPRLAPLPPGARTGVTLGIGRPIPLARARSRRRLHGAAAAARLGRLHRARRARRSRLDPGRARADHRVPRHRTAVHLQGDRPTHARDDHPRERGAGRVPVRRAPSGAVRDIERRDPQRPRPARRQRAHLAARTADRPDRGHAHASPRRSRSPARCGAASDAIDLPLGTPPRGECRFTRV